jgi:hypothetical protein
MQRRDFLGVLSGAVAWPPTSVVHCEPIIRGGFSPYQSALPAPANLLRRLRQCYQPKIGIIVSVRETIAKWFIEAAKNGERDFGRLHDQALEAFGIVDLSVVVVSVGRNLPVPAYASVTHAA